MQIDFSLDHEYTPEWRDNDKLPEAEQFSTTLTILDVADLMFLLDTFSEAGIEGEVDAVTLDVDQLKPIIKSTGHLLPKYVTVTNLRKKAGGDELDINVVVKYPYFLALAAELLMKLAEVSSPNEDDVGNSNAPPASEQTP